MFHIAPTTFQGISSGNAIRTRHTGTQMPFFGMASATAMPSGTSITKMVKVKNSCRPSAA